MREEVGDRAVGNGCRLRRLERLRVCLSGLGGRWTRSEVYFLLGDDYSGSRSTLDGDFVSLLNEKFLSRVVENDGNRAVFRYYVRGDGR